jgi:hypothetical protein
VKGPALRQRDSKQKRSQHGQERHNAEPKAGTKNYSAGVPHASTSM